MFAKRVEVYDLKEYILEETSLNRDRAFSREYMEELRPKEEQFWEETIEITRNLQRIARDTQKEFNAIDSNYKVWEVTNSVSRVDNCGILFVPEFEELSERIHKTLAKLDNDIFQYDTQLASKINEVNLSLGGSPTKESKTEGGYVNIQTRIENLRQLLLPETIDMSIDEFHKKLKEVQRNWAEDSGSYAKEMEAIQEDMYGVTARAVRYSQDPVNLSTGNFVYDHEDMKVAGEIPLSFHRYYNAKDRKKGTLGRCFRHNYEMALTAGEDKSSVIICMQDGQRKVFRKNMQGYYEGAYSATEELTEEGEGFCLTTQDGSRYHFDKAGRLIRQEDRREKGITFTYNEEGQLSKAESDHGDFLCYFYDEAGQLIRVEDHTGRTVELSYEKKRLVSLRNPQGSIYRYVYGRNGKITETGSPRGVRTVENTYDEKHRITEQEFADGGHMSFAYEDGKGRVVLTERNGSKITYVHDAKYRNTDVLYEDGTKEHFGYNEKNYVVLYTDRNGNTTHYAYDARGNLTQIINALGQKTNMTYDANNCLLSRKVNGKDRLHNSYDTQGNLLSSVGADGKGSFYSYDEGGRLIRAEVSDVGAAEFSYDVKGNLTKVRNAVGAETVYVYDALNRVSQVTDGNGNSYTYEYDSADRITKITNPLGDSRSYCYNESGKVTKVTDFDGYQVEASYNEINKLSSFTDKEGNRTRYTYDKMWNLTEVEQADGGKHTYLYDAEDRLVEERLPGGGRITYDLDGNGNRIRVTDAVGNVTTYTYDSLNRVTAVQEANGAITAYEYDEEGNLAKMTDALGNVILYTYDEMGRRTGVTDALGNRTSCAYDGEGRPKRIIYPDKTAEERTYAHGLLTEILHRDGSRIHYGYDNNNNLILARNELGEETRYEYDALNRMVAMINAEGARRSFAYDAVGNRTCVVDENGNETHYKYSQNGKLIAIIDACGNQTCYNYDCMGHLVSIASGGEGQDSRITRYERNLTGRITQVTDPAGDVERYAYDHAGHMTDKRDRDGYHTTFTYGKGGELETILYGDGRSVSFSYDALRHLEEIKDWNGTTKFVMDALGRPLCVTDAEGRTVAYEWGSMGERQKLCYPGGREAVYSYNAVGRMEALSTPQGIIHYAYDEAGRLKEKALPNGITTTYSYNRMGRLAEICHRGADFTESYRYRYDAAGNKIGADKQRDGMEADSGSFGYVYDALNRLTGVTKDGRQVREYCYDTVGNRIQKIEHKEGELFTTRYCYNGKGQLIAEDNGIHERTYDYDRRGNLTQISQGGRLLQRFTFDAANRMTDVLDMETESERRAEFSYNGLGQRIGQDIRGATGKAEKKLRYTLDLTRQYHNLLQLTDAALGKQQTFYWDGNVAEMEETGEGFFYLQDDLGSPMSLSDGQGSRMEDYGYDEFGDSAAQMQRQPFGFTGYQREEVGNLYFAQARRYDAGVGRFVSEDLIKGTVWDPATLNHYGYCWNRPVDLVDLNGMFPDWAVDILKWEMDTLEWAYHTSRLPRKWFRDFNTTIGAGATGNVAVGDILSGVVSLQLVLEPDCDWDLQLSYGMEAFSSNKDGTSDNSDKGLGMNINGAFTLSVYPGVDDSLDLLGPFLSCGGTVAGGGVAVGADLIYAGSDNNDLMGVSLSLGGGAGAEIHTLITNTISLRDAFGIPREECLQQ